MAAEAIMQIVPVLVAMLSIVWHQQHSTNRLDDKINALDDRMEAKINALDDRMEAKINALDDRMEAKFNRVDDTLKMHGERLARIEAKLEIEPPAEAA